MYTYLISYDLRIPETSQDYKKLIDFIKTYQGYAKPLKSLWLINTSNSASQVRDDLNNQVDSNDGILVIDVTDADWATTGIHKNTTEWMKNNL